MEDPLKQMTEEIESFRKGGTNVAGLQKQAAAPYDTAKLILSDPQGETYDAGEYFELRAGTPHGRPTQAKLQIYPDGTWKIAE